MLQGDITSVPTSVLEGKGSPLDRSGKNAPADIWLLAPPCQPYTRRGLKRGSSDGRAGSFLKLLQRIPSLKVRGTRALLTW